MDMGTATTGTAAAERAPMPRLGQHFLTSEHHLARIVDAAQVEADDRILEIGPGTGLLTRKLLERGADVVAIELDRALARALPLRLEGLPGTFRLIQGDAARIEWPRFDKLVANLPYQISSPVLFRLLDERFALAVLTVQREFADRLVAKPGTGEYGRLTVKAALQTRSERLFRIPRGAFDPPPRVESACVRIQPDEPPPLLDRALFDQLVDRAFTQRRKMLRKSLAEIEGAPPVLEAMGLAEARPETVAPVVWAELADQVHRVRGGAD